MLTATTARKKKVHTPPVSREDDRVNELTGTVIAINGDIVEIRNSIKTCHAKRAFSCLVQPEVGDLVLLVGRPPGDCYVQAVLERPGCQDARVTVAGNLTVELRSGRFVVAATEGVDLVSNKAVSVTADRLDVRSRLGNFYFSTVRLIAGAVESTLEQINMGVKRIFRRVEEIEHVRANQIDVAAKGNLRLHGENTLLTARQLVKADGKQIHIG